MSTYNVLHADVTCPHCQHSWNEGVEGFFGLGDLIDYKIGDTVQWVPRKAPQNGGRPDNGTVDAEGYVECPNCKRDSFWLIAIEEDLITGIRFDPSKPGYVNPSDPTDQ